MELRFVYGDLKLFHKIINNETCVELPEYLELISPEEVMPGSEESEVAGYVRLTRIRIIFCLHY